MGCLLPGLTLIRLPNLLIALLTQAMAHQLLIRPALMEGNLVADLQPVDLLALMLATVFVTAGGYIWNDIMDYPIDLVNKPGKVIIRKKITLPMAYWLYACCNLAGWVLALYLAWTHNKSGWFLLYPISAGGLFWYSLRLKQRPLWGNLLISLYCAGVPALVWLAEQETLSQLKLIQPELYIQTANTVAAYALFAFLTNLFREIVKDLQDMPGDCHYQLRTLPLVIGTQKAHAILLFIGGLLILSLVIWAKGLAPGLPAWLLLLVGIMVPLAFNLIQLFKAPSPQRYALISRITKGIMLIGLLLLLLTHYYYV